MSIVLPHADLLPSPAVATVNLRSVTTARDSEGLRVFCKTSHLSLRREAEILAREKHYDAGAVRAVPFVSYDQARNELVTEYVEGDNLFNVLWNHTGWAALPRTVDGVHDLVRGVAAWLAAFHRRWPTYSAAMSSPAAASAQVKAAVEEKLNLLSATLSTTSGNAGLLERLRALARSAAAAPGWDALPVSMIHADFTPGNIVVRGDGKAFVADFADARVGFSLEDVVRLWSSIWELAQTSGRRRTTFEPLLGEILTINGFSADVQHSAPFLLMREWNSVTKLLEVKSMEGRVGPGTMFVLRRIARVHRNWLERTSSSSTVLSDSSRRATGVTHVTQRTAVRSARVILPIVFEWTGMPRSVVDVGCATGHWLRAALDLGVREVHGIDDDCRRHEPLMIPADTVETMDLSTPDLSQRRRFDLALSIEAADYLQPAAAARFVEFLTSLSPKILFAAAMPGQGGPHHVNEQLPTFWQRLFARHSFVMLDPIRPQIWQNVDIDPAFAQNLFLFVHGSALEGNERLRVEATRTAQQKLTIVETELAWSIPPVPRAAHLLFSAVSRSLRRRTVRLLLRMPGVRTGPTIRALIRALR